MSEITRRGFLQGLAALAGTAAFVGVPDGKSQAAQAAAKSILDAAPEVLRKPITARDPLCWLEINGEQYPLLDARVDIQREIASEPYMGLYNGFQRMIHVPMPTTWEMYVEADGQEPVSQFLSMQKQSFRLRLPHGGVFEGSGYFMEMNSEFDGFATWNATIVGNGDLARIA